MSDFISMGDISAVGLCVDKLNLEISRANNPKDFQLTKNIQFHLEHLILYINCAIRYSENFLKEPYEELKSHLIFYKIFTQSYTLETNPQLICENEQKLIQDREMLQRIFEAGILTAEENTTLINYLNVVSEHCNSLHDFYKASPV